MKHDSRLLVFLLVLSAAWMHIVAQPLCSVYRYNEDDGVPSAHVTQLLQDEQGFMWFSTWNGLCRYDGYEFQTFKPKVGGGCHMTTDRIRNIDLLPNGRILCRVDNAYYIFDLNTYRFCDLSKEESEKAEEIGRKYRQSRSLLKGKTVMWTDAHQTEWTLHGDGILTYMTKEGDVVYPLQQNFQTLSFTKLDHLYNLWAIDDGSIYKFCTDLHRTKRLDIVPKAEVKCLFADSKSRYWIGTKDDATLRIYDSHSDKLLGFLGKDGRIHQGYTSFGAAVYCMYESHDGTLWLGTKPDGLYRLCPISVDVFKIDHFTDIPLPHVYHIQEDRYGRLWLATLGGGICYTTEKEAETLHFTVPKHYPMDVCSRARYLYFTEDDVLLVATDNGLLVSKMEADAQAMQFNWHHRESDRAESLSSSATMDVMQDRQGRLYVSTESGGVNQLMSNDCLAPSLSFRHLSDQFHVQPNDIVLSMAPTDEGGLMAIGSHLMTLIDSTGQGRVLDARYFQGSYRFSEAHPLKLSDGRWLIGLTDGAFIITKEQMLRRAYVPHLVLTRLSIQKGSSYWNAEDFDTLTLAPRERSMSVSFAALDYTDPERISYAFRLLPNEQWNYIGHDRSATLIDLEPGHYQLEIRSTNVDGEWQDNSRTLTIIVKPTFWESVWGQLLILFLVIGTMGVIAYTLLYIRRIKRKQHETLEAYLSLIEGGGESIAAGEPSKLRHIPFSSQPPQHTSQELDPSIKRVMDFIEKNIANSDVSVGDMADAAAISRSGLQRKLRQTMGITPQDLLREARIKHACLLLTQTTRSVSEIAYACGFTDPKYFSRCFKQSIGQSPSEYKISVS